MKKEDSKVTIYDVAAAAGVSKSTVSRYLGGRFHEISPKTQKKIEHVIQQLNYRPNNLARGLKGNRSYLIGAIVADITNPYTTAILRGAEDVCKQHGYSLLICNSDNQPSKEREYISMLQSHQIDGVFVQTTGGNQDFLQELSRNGETPIVLVDRKIPELSFDTVGIDNHHAVLQAVSYLLKQGYERIAYFTEPVQEISPRRERYVAFLEALQIENEEHQSLNDIYELDVHDKDLLDSQLAAFLADSKGQARAILTANSVVALKLILSIKEKGLQIPKDIALMSFDNPSWAAAIESGITTMVQPTYQIGSTVAELILKRINGEQTAVQTVAYQTRLFERGSTPKV
ncbi:LacI family DNA-binding transcriptional regulator [Heyndrickxia ginsengihumi]|uniref:LacI family DNA-binding transcriptional regulator n=1 Tax=Heyndrickxia ginsengihumi TaxID=363870 RepID=UPI00203C9328|nr:LacI family DNA-binding transcriptional regulator [Heyndrickxia ginsengihumi]MCM3023729.1 LacI family transcriptional regulator [Heyndrickxia ginsengihumi]